jgi:hypothetical protein
MKYFIITIDTEGDNLWEARTGDTVTTKNAQFIPRFQELCNTYQFKPVYLTNYEMANNSFFTEFAKDAQNKQQCEIGLHLHAWNSPPEFMLATKQKNGGHPYLIEYPESIMREKFRVMFDTLTEKFGQAPVSHRSGRWATNQQYFDIVIDHGIKVDCSVTPHVSWVQSSGYTDGSTGTDYRNYPEEPYPIQHSKNNSVVWEIPVTIRTLHHRNYLSAGELKRALFGRTVWLRPNGSNLLDMTALAKKINESNSEYLMIMLHSSELMPAGSPNFTTAKSIEKLYEDLEALFAKIAESFTGISLRD